MRFVTWGLSASMCLLSSCVTAPVTRGVPPPDARMPGLKLAFYDDDWRSNREPPRLRGEQLVPLLEKAGYDAIQRALDGAPRSAPWAAKELLELAPALVERALESERGRRLLDRLYDELLAGNEPLAAQDVLALKARRIPPERFVQAVLDPRTKVFPIRKMGVTVFESATLGGWRRADGGIDVWYPSRLPRDHPEARALPKSGGEIRLGEDEVVCVKLYDLGGPLRCGPALMLLQYAREADTKLVWDWVNLALLALPLGSGTGSGARTAGALVWFDRAAITLGVLSAVLDDHRGWILEKLGARGEAFLRYADLVQTAVALYGLARIATAVPRLFSELGAEHQRFKQAVRSTGATLGPEEHQALQDLDGTIEKLLGEAEGLRTAGGADIIPIERARRLQPSKRPAAQPEPSIQEAPLRATGTDGRPGAVGEESGTRVVASTGDGRPKKPLTAAPPSSQSTRSTGGGGASWSGGP